MGSVWRARDRSTGVTVALKRLVRWADRDAQRFAREAEVLARVSHPNVVRYVAHGRDEHGALYLAMEWIDGDNLTEHLRAVPLPVDDVVALGVQLAGALSAVHGVGVVHRDVK